MPVYCILMKHIGSVIDYLWTSFPIQSSIKKVNKRNILRIFIFIYCLFILVTISSVPVQKPELVRMLCIDPEVEAEQFINQEVNISKPSDVAISDAGIIGTKGEYFSQLYILN